MNSAGVQQGIIPKVLSVFFLFKYSFQKFVLNHYPHGGDNLPRHVDQVIDVKNQVAIPWCSSQPSFTPLAGFLKSTLPSTNEFRIISDYNRLLKKIWWEMAANRNLWSCYCNACFYSDGDLFLGYFLFVFLWSFSVTYSDVISETVFFIIYFFDMLLIPCVLSVWWNGDLKKQCVRRIIKKKHATCNSALETGFIYGFTWCFTAFTLPYKCN